MGGQLISKRRAPTSGGVGLLAMMTTPIRDQCRSAGLASGEPDRFARSPVRLVGIDLADAQVSVITERQAARDVRERI